ncbi:hypothetical protein PPYR_05104 [Photinus pyralis]|uniref:Dynein regulatory complex subunit 2 n=3 Tax=Photinus pyralis TaxID=7054 RepID=A0A5N4B078_PHOPY|nr:dynein regulatory complex subunit 2-like [Photinus pyralis]KAB0802918.1 hypothetical protein PPYR_05104 [Photinus pyralis]
MPLSPEEKAALKLQKKEQKKRDEEFKRRKIKHDEISREVKYGRLTLKSNERKWRRMLIEISLPRMRSELEYAWHNFERIIDVKDFTISYLLDELDQAEEQYVANVKCHSEHIDDLIHRFNNYLQELKFENEGHLNKLQDQTNREVEEIERNAAEADEYFKTMLFGLEAAKKEQELRVRGEYLSKIDEESTKYKNIIRELRAVLEKNYADLWVAIKLFLYDFEQQTMERRKSYNILASQDELLQKVCLNQNLKLIRMQDALKNLKRQYSQAQKSQKQKLTDLLNEQQYFSDAFTTLKGRMNNDKRIDSTNLTLLTEESSIIWMHLKKILEKGRKAQQLAGFCRKLETLREKTLPFPKYDTDDDEVQIEEHPATASLELFWKRVAQADAIRHGINEEREYLKRENRMLQIQIHNYCMCVDCPGLESENHKQTSGKPTVTEGDLMRKQYDKFK